MKSDAKFEEKLTCGLENDMRHEEFDKIFTRALEGLKNFHFNGLLLSKVYIV